MFSASAQLAMTTPAPSSGAPRGADPSRTLNGGIDVLLRLLGLPQDRVEPYADTAVPIWRVREGDTLLIEGEHARTLHVVRSGSFKCLRTQEDGYEQVVSFAQMGALLGIEALHGGVQLVNAVALEDATVYALAAPALPRLHAQCPLLHEALWRGLGRQMAHAAETGDMMAAVSALSRLARFMLWQSRQMAEAGRSPSRLHLRMPRRDIASLLGVAQETVSRSFTQLAREGCLRVVRREVEILDLQALRGHACYTRRLPAMPIGAVRSRCLRRRPQGGLPPAPGPADNRPAATSSRPAHGPIEHRPVGT